MTEYFQEHTSNSYPHLPFNTSMGEKKKSSFVCLLSTTHTPVGHCCRHVWVCVGCYDCCRLIEMCWLNGAGLDVETRHLFISASAEKDWSLGSGSGGRVVVVAGIPLHFVIDHAFISAHTSFCPSRVCRAILTAHLYEAVMHFSHDGHTAIKTLRYNYPLIAVYTLPRKGKKPK